MKIIKVYDTKDNEYKIKVDNEDYDELMKYQWIWRDGYAVRKMNGSYYGLHRHLLSVAWKEDVIVDHINGDHTLNTRANLRRASRFENQQNRKTNEGNTYPKGIRRLPSGAFNVRVQAFNQRIGGGTFETLEEALNKRNEIAQALHKEFYRPAHPIEDNNEQRDYKNN